MLSELFAVLATATLSLAATPSGFQPASEIPLTVSYNGMDASSGKIVAKEVSTNAPQIAVASKLAGTSFAILMMDLDIPTNSPPATSTLLHWMQTGLTQSMTETLLNTTAGTNKVFALQVPGAIPAMAPYISPNPPARVPLSHRYTEILVDTSTASQQSMDVLMMAAQTRGGFNAETVLTQAGLADKVVAGNFFVVSNPGPAQAANATTGTTTGTGSSSGTGSGIGTGTGTGSNAGTSSVATSESTVIPTVAAGVLNKADGLVLGFAIITALFFSL